VARWRINAPPLAVYRRLDEKDRISFGDIFESGHLIDVHIRPDASALGGGPLPRKQAERIANQMNRGELAPGESIDVYTPALRQGPEQWHVLGNGVTMKLEGSPRAILLSDSCVVDTVLDVDRPDRRPRGRLLFAPVVRADDAKLASLTENKEFGRFPLAGEGDFPGGIIEMGQCFMVDWRGVDAKHRVLGLDEDAAEDLQVAWTAYALRRGPAAVQHSFLKFASLLAAEAAADRQPALDAIEAALVVAWRLEGRALTAVADAALGEPERLAAVLDEVVELETAAHEAREQLARIAQG
jgi:hypothetical protein